MPMKQPNSYYKNILMYQLKDSSANNRYQNWLERSSRDDYAMRCLKDIIITIFITDITLRDCLDLYINFMKNQKLKFTPQQNILLKNYFTTNNHFNTWHQIAKAKLTHSLQQDPQHSKIYHAHSVINLSNRSFVAIGQGKNKKDAKKASIQKLIIEIAQEGFLHLGFKQQNYMQKIRQHIPYGQNNITQQNYEQGLKNLQQLQYIELNDIIGIWQYLCRKQQQRELSRVIGIIGNTYNDANKKYEQRKKINKQLKKYYNSVDRRSTFNSFDTYDLESLITWDQEIQQTQEWKAEIKLIDKELQECIGKLDQLTQLQKQSKHMFSKDKGLQLIKSIGKYIEQQVKRLRQKQMDFNIFQPNTYQALSLLTPTQEFRVFLLGNISKIREMQKSKPRLQDMPQPQIYRPKVKKKRVQRKVLDVLYEQLLSLVQKQVGIRIAEQIYCKVQIDEQQFDGQYWDQYYMHMKNLIFHQHYQSLFRVSSQSFPIQLTNTDKQTIIHLQSQKKHPLQAIKYILGSWVIVETQHQKFRSIVRQIDGNKLRILSNNRKPGSGHMQFIGSKKPYTNQSNMLKCINNNIPQLTILYTPLHTHKQIILLIHTYLTYSNNLRIIIICLNRQHMEKYAKMLKGYGNRLVITSSYQDGEWDYVIVEGGKEVEILYYFTKGKKAILIQDEQDLIVGKSAIGVSKSICIPLISKILRGYHPFYKFNYQAYFLQHQQIIYQDIFDWYNQRYYRGRLIYAVQDNLSYVKGFPWEQGQRIAWVHIPNHQLKYNHGLINIAELQCVLQILQSILQTGFTTYHQVGILTSTEQQKQLLLQQVAKLVKTNTNLFKQPLYLQQSISTIQQQTIVQREVMLCTLVRSNKEKKIGSLRDSKKLLKCLNRGRRGVILVGNLQTFIKNECWSDLISLINKKKSIFIYKI